MTVPLILDGPLTARRRARGCFPTTGVIHVGGVMPGSRSRSRDGERGSCGRAASPRRRIPPGSQVECVLPADTTELSIGAYQRGRSTPAFDRTIRARRALLADPRAAAIARSARAVAPPPPRTARDLGAVPGPRPAPCDARGGDRLGARADLHQLGAGAGRRRSRDPAVIAALDRVPRTIRGSRWSAARRRAVSRPPPTPRSNARPASTSRCWTMTTCSLATRWRTSPTR